MMYSELYVGIDVSKHKHDVAVINESKKLVRKPFVIKEDYTGYRYLIDQLQSVRYGKRNWQLPLRAIDKMKKLTENSIGYKKGTGSGYVVQSLVRHIQMLQSEIQILKGQIVELYSHITEGESLLCSIYGITKETAIVLEAYIGDVSRFATSKQIVAYFGMNPTVNRSGKSTKRQSYLEKKGSGIIRHKLFMTLLSIIRSQEGPVYTYYIRLVESGKPKMVAMCAAMRKLLVIIYTMLKNQVTFDPVSK